MEDEYEIKLEENYPEMWEEQKDWEISKQGDLTHIKRDYYISHDRLSEDDWLLHLITKGWFDANTFLPAYFEACKRAGIKEVTIKTTY